MTFVTVRTERKPARRARIGTITAFRAAVRIDGDRIVITPSRGASIREVGDEGETLREYEDDFRSLLINIGDRVMLWGPALDEIVVVRAQAVSRDGLSAWGRAICGALAPTTTRVRLFAMCQDRAAKQLALFGKRRRRA